MNSTSWWNFKPAVRKCAPYAQLIRQNAMKLEVYFSFAVNSQYPSNGRLWSKLMRRNWSVAPPEVAMVVSDFPIHQNSPGLANFPQMTGLRHGWDNSAQGGVSTSCEW